LDIQAEPRILEFVTMCGHSLIGSSLVIYLIERVKRVAMTAAAVQMGKQCACNFFNNVRASRMINDLIKEG
jgi:hypothetical protein